MPAVDWQQIKLVVFDVDGTLYDQRFVRARMARDLLLSALQRRSLKTLSVLKAFRRIREELAEAEVDEFEAPLIEKTAAACACSAEDVRQIVAEWIETRPLPYVAAARYKGLPALFAGIKQSGKQIGILSDYAAARKLEALELRADFIVSAQDAIVGRLKPHPRGLEVLMSLARVAPEETCLIGDRIERDGLAAQRAGAAWLIRSSRSLTGWHTFPHYQASLFSDLLL
jgi:putative hydrolase of the HAD superfamily